LVIKELIKYPSDYSFVVFQDEIFPWNEGWLDEFCIRYPVEVGQPFFAHVRPEFHKRETISELVRVGMTESGIGLQSASIEILKGVYNRHLLPNQALKMAETLTDLGVSFPYHVLVDNPFETEIDMRLTLDWLWEAPSQNTTVMYLTSFPLSPLGKRIQEENPEYLPAHLISWYAWLMSLASGRRLKKRLTKVVFFMGIFKKHPGFLYFVWNFVLRLAEWGRNVTK